MEENYNIYGKITLNIDFDIYGINEEDALIKAKELLEDYFRLNVNNVPYLSDHGVEMDIDACEIEYED